MSTISTGNTLTTGFIVSSDTSGNLVLNSANTLVLTSANTMSLNSAGRLSLNSTGNLVLTSANTLSVTSTGNLVLTSANTMSLNSTGNLVLTSANTLSVTSTGNLVLTSAGSLSLNAINFLNANTNSLGLSRIPAEQFYRLDSALVGANATGAQSILGVGVTLVASTVYQFELVFCLVKSAGTTSHTIGVGFGGTATLNNIGFSVIFAQSATTGTVNGQPAASSNQFYILQATNTTISAAISAAAQAFYPVIRGTVSVNAGGTFIPQYSLSVAPGGAYSTQIGSYFKISPLAASGSNVNIGTWA